VQAQRNNELTQQLQDKKRQLFSAIQVRHRAALGLVPGCLRCIELPHSAGCLPSFPARPHACSPPPACGRPTPPHHHHTHTHTHHHTPIAPMPPPRGCVGARGPAPAGAIAGGQVPRVPGGAAVQDVPRGEHCGPWRLRGGSPVVGSPVSARMCVQGHPHGAAAPVPRGRPCCSPHLLLPLPPTINSTDPPSAGSAQLRGASLPALPLLRRLLPEALHHQPLLPRLQLLHHRLPCAAPAPLTRTPVADHGLLNGLWPMRCLAAVAAPGLAQPQRHTCSPPPPPPPTHCACHETTEDALSLLDLITFPYSMPANSCLNSFP
jgi:hypothetical protein